MVTGDTPVEVFAVKSLVPVLVLAATTAFPVKVAAVPLWVGTPAGQAIVPLGVKLTVPFVPAGV